MKKEEIIVMLGTAHLDEILGKCSPDKSLRECVYSRQIVADVKAKLESCGYKVFVDYEPLNKSDKMTGSGTLQSRELEYRVRVVNSLCAKYGKEKCLYVSIHVNAAGSDGKWHGAGGWCCYTSKGRTKADNLAECMYDAAFSNLKGYVKIMDEGKRRGDYTEKQTPFRMDKTDGDRDLEADLFVVRKTACPAVLTENLFQDNKRDVAFLLSDEGRHAIARLHVEGIMNYIQKYML